MNYELLTAVLGLLFLLSCSFFFSASETAIFHLHRFTIERLSQRFKTLRILQHREILLGTILFGNTLVNVGVGALGTYLLYQMFQDLPKSAELILIGVITCILLICGEITPKLYSLRKSEAIAIKVTPVLNIFRYLFLPITLPLEALIARFSLKSPARLTKDEFRSFIKAEAKEKNITGREEEIILKLLEFKKLKVSDLMTPLANLELLSISTELSEPVISNLRHSRIPVYEGERNKIKGILYVKDLLRQNVETQNFASLQNLIRQPYFISPEMNAGELLLQFRRRKIHIAIVGTSRQGGTVSPTPEALGIITLDDLINKIIK